MQKYLFYYSIINGMLVSLEYGLSFVPRCSTNKVTFYYVRTVLRQFSLLIWFTYLASKKPKLQQRKQNISTIDKLKLIGKMITMDAIMETWHWFLLELMLTSDATIMHWSTFMQFIAKSFLFEVMFDFFHYWMHRICHSSRYLYIAVHKTHHRNTVPYVLTTFDHNIFDLALTNMMPFLAATYFISFGPKWHQMEIQWLLVYKTYVEMAGHSGLQLKGVSFPQFPWLQWWLNAGLSIRDHDMHHRYPTVNFSKRFKIFDKLFSTYHVSKATQ